SIPLAKAEVNERIESDIWCRQTDPPNRSRVTCEILFPDRVQGAAAAQTILPAGAFKLYKQEPQAERRLATVLRLPRQRSLRDHVSSAARLLRLRSLGIPVPIGVQQSGFLLWVRPSGKLLRKNPLK